MYSGFSLFIFSCVFFRDGLTPNFGGVNNGFGDQKILSDLGWVVGISKEIPSKWGKIPQLNGLIYWVFMSFYLRIARSESYAGLIFVAKTRSVARHHIEESK